MGGEDGVCAVPSVGVLWGASSTGPVVVTSPVLLAPQVPLHDADVGVEAIGPVPTQVRWVEGILKTERAGSRVQVSSSSAWAISCWRVLLGNR